MLSTAAGDKPGMGFPVKGIGIDLYSEENQNPHSHCSYQNCTQGILIVLLQRLLLTFHFECKVIANVIVSIITYARTLVSLLIGNTIICTKGDTV